MLIYMCVLIEHSIKLNHTYNYTHIHTYVIHIHTYAYKML